MKVHTHSLISRPIRWRLAACLLCLLAAGNSTRAEGIPGEAPASQPAGAIAPSPDDKPGLVSNVWIDTELRQTFQDVSSQTGVAVLCEQSVQGLVTLAVKDMPLEECLERICSVGGYAFVKIKDYYLVGRPEPGSAIFQRTAFAHRLKLSYATCDQVKAMLHSSLAQYVTFDKITGSVLITAPEAVRERIVESIRLIDAPPQQVAIEAIVFELTEEGSKQLGLDWQYKDAGFSAAFSNLIGTVTYDSGSDVATYVELTLRAIIQDRKGRVLANPRILVMNGQEAEMFVGQEKYFSLLSGQASNPYYRLESIKAGVTLKVAPQIGENGEISLVFEPEVSDVVAENNRDSLNGNGDSTNSPLPVVTRRRAKTVVGIKNGQTILIGGLLREQQRSTVEKVPFLGDIPVAGAPFRSIKQHKEQQEVVILITAQLMSPDEQAGSVTKGRVERRYVSPLDAVFKDTQGALPCSAGR